MSTWSRPLPKLILVAAVQLAILLSIIGFKQYTVWTSETVLLKVQPVDPRDLIRGDFIAVQYDISRIDTDDVAGDRYADGKVYVELERGDDGYWNAVAIHDDREHSFDGTVLIEGHTQRRSSSGILLIEYGIEEIFIPEGSGADLPFGPDHTVAVEVKVDRFGNAVPRRFFVNGEPFDLERR